jgi:hypothetical protein
MVTVLLSYYHRIRFGHVEARNVRLVGTVLKIIQSVNLLLKNADECD